MFRLYFVPLAICLLFSCARSGTESGGGKAAEVFPSGNVPPMAVLRAGVYPLWFQVSSDGPPVLLDSVDDARFAAALIPWPLAPHIRFILAKKNELQIALNRNGFVRLALWGEYSPPHGSGGTDGDIGLYYFSGGELWRQYTVGAFVLYDGSPAAMLYLDDRFLDSNAPLPFSRFWTFDPQSAVPQALEIPLFEGFPGEEGWNADMLLPGRDGQWYYRLVKKGSGQPEIRMFRSAGLAEAGQPVTLGAFQNAALPEPLSAAPAPLCTLLAAAFTAAGGGTAAVVSPDFAYQRYFTGNGGNTPPLAAFWGGEFSPGQAAAVLPDGRGWYIGPEPDTAPEFCALPPLPEGFVYTGIGFAGDILFAAWEEQEEYSIGAAGFMVLRPGW
ncbi:MAG: hypothetical protein LBD48_11790 [Treponema sp.]|jgi:hypothetical protein|nr:hypothetical protein [Treponema sp.]